MELYTMTMSVPCHAVQLTAKAVGVELTKIPTDIFAGDHLKEDFVAINPQHSVPTLVDDGLTLWESRAICQYLVNQYAEDDSLYPKEPKLRAKVDALINFDMGTLFRLAAGYAFPVVKEGASPDPDKLEKLQEAVGWLNGFLEGNDYVAGESMTIADHILVATASVIQECGIDMSEYDNVTAWIARCQENMDGYEEENGEGAKMFGELFKSKLE